MSKNSKKKNGKKKLKTNDIEFIVEEQLVKLIEENPNPDELIKIVVGINVPDDFMKEYNLTEEEVKEVATGSTAVVYEMFTAYLKNKKGIDKGTKIPDFYA